MDRRNFMKTTLAGAALLSANPKSLVPSQRSNTNAKIALIKHDNRKLAVNQLLNMIDFPSPQGKPVFIKPNFNTADPFPGSTHNETLDQLIREFKERGSQSISVGDRSGPQPTGEVLKNKGIIRMSEKLGFKVRNFSELPEQEWIHFNPKRSHWKNGFYLASPAVNSPYLVATHCLKTHQYGGIFTLSLKLTVGMVPKRLMRELHSSPKMRSMIAELNQPFQPKLLIMDGVEAFVDGGPMTGTRKQANVFLAGSDRVAMDAVGVAILKELGSNSAIMEKKIFEQEQIERAARLGIGISHPEKIELIANDPTSIAYTKKIKEILLKG
ncbi:MAG: DUF362 domain-containing protein [Candidatus Aminicenantes bacterium]|nr:DUF362 domain-containing protein [Candidatus Aminicenantes bacterium]